jgi:transposase InsO family protein
VRYQAIERLAGSHPVRRLCRTLGGSPSGYYRWQRRGEGDRAREDRRLKQRIVALHGETKGRYGTPRVERALRRQGISTSRKRVGRLRRELGLRAKAAKKYKATTDSRHPYPVAPNRLERRFVASKADRIWVGDITYLWTREGWLYLAIVLDTCSRRIVGWSVSESLERELAVSALEKALASRRPAPGLVHHTDRGAQYASGDYRDLVEQTGLVFSMSRKGDCWDNAVAESFFSTLKAELVHRNDYVSRSQARASIFEYIEAFYNGRRRHSALGYVSPVEHESAAARHGDAVAARRGAA